MVRSPQSTSRRGYLAAIGATGVALSGCLTIGGNHGATDVMAYSAATEPKTVLVEVRDADSDDPVASSEFDIDPGEEVGPINDGKLPTNGSYVVDVDVADGPSETFEWADPSLDRAPLYVLVDDSDNVDFLLKAG